MTSLKSRGVLAVTGIAVVTAAVSVAVVRRAEAFKEVEPGKHMFGMIGLTRLDTVRVNVVNLAESDRRGKAPKPCHVIAVVLDAMGNELARGAYILEGGHAHHLDVNGGMVSGPETRPPVRAEVTFLNRCGPAASTLEVFDTATGEGGLILHPAVIKGFNPQPDPPGVTGAPGR